MTVTAISSFRRPRQIRRCSCNLLKRISQCVDQVVDLGALSDERRGQLNGVPTVSDVEALAPARHCNLIRPPRRLAGQGEETTRFLDAADSFLLGVDDIHRRLGGQLEIGIFDKTATNPAARIGETIAMFAASAPEVALQIQVSTMARCDRAGPDDLPLGAHEGMAGAAWTTM